MSPSTDTASDSPTSTAATGRSVALAGATGLVGRSLLQGLLADPSVSRVHALGRRLLDFEHPKLTAYSVDFTALPTLPLLHEVYLALGTTIKVAGSQAAFKAVDYAANLAVATAAHAAGARRVGLVSAMGADPNSRIFYSRTKGELEQALAALDYEALVIARPSVLLGDREALGQPPRLGETLATHASRLFKPVIPHNYRPIAASSVAAALLERVPVAHQREVLFWSDMQR